MVARRQIQGRLPEVKRTERPMLNAPQAVGFVIIYAFYLVIFFVGPDFIVPTQGADAQTVRDIALDIHDVTDRSGGYYYTALLLSLLPAGLESLIVMTISA